MIDSAEACARSPAYRLFQRLRLLIVGFLVALAALIVVVRPRAWPGAAGLAAFAALSGFLFGWRLRAILRDAARACDALAAVAREALDRPADVVAHEGDAGLDELASNPAFARAIGRRSVRFAVAGTWRGQPLEYGSAVTASRDVDFTISHVRVGARGGAGLFRVMSTGLATRMSRWHRPQHRVETGDAAFDQGWVVDADEAAARRALDDGVRAQLVAMRRELPSMATASVERTATGLIVRWPGALTPASAARLRDLALAIDAKLAA